MASKGDNSRSNCHNQRLFACAGLFIDHNVWVEGFGQSLNTENHPWPRAVNPVGIDLDYLLIAYRLQLWPMIKKR